MRLFDLGECDAALMSFQAALEANPADTQVTAYIAELQRLKARDEALAKAAMAKATPPPAAVPEPPNATLLFVNEYATGYLEVRTDDGTSILRVPLSLEKGRDSAQLVKPFRIPKGKGLLEVKLLVPAKEVDLQATIARPPEGSGEAVLQVARKTFPKRLSLAWK